MTKTSLFATAVLFLASGLFLMGECQFLVPYRGLLIHKYGLPIAVFTSALFLNVFMIVHLLCRKLFLKETGRKLAHIEKQLRRQGSISQELAELIKD